MPRPSLLALLFSMPSNSLPSLDSGAELFDSLSFLSEDQRPVAQLERDIIPWATFSNEQPQSTRKIHAQSALKSAEGFLRRSASTGAQSFGDGTGARAEIERQIQQLVEWAEVNGRLIDPIFAQRSDLNIGGVEHGVFHEEFSGRWIKITKPGRCGKAQYVYGEEEVGVPPATILDDALPIDYLERLRLTNTNFGDNLCLHGVINGEAGPQLVISQRHVPGVSATTEEIVKYFEDLGFEYLREKTFYDSSLNLLISDAHSGNMLRLENGIIVAIDMIVQRPTGALRRAVMPRETLSFDD